MASNKSLLNSGAIWEAKCWQNEWKIKAKTEMEPWSVKTVGKRVRLKNCGSEWVWYWRLCPKRSVQRWFKIKPITNPFHFIMLNLPERTQNNNAQPERERYVPSKMKIIPKENNTSNSSNGNWEWPETWYVNRPFHMYTPCMDCRDKGLTHTSLSVKYTNKQTKNNSTFQNHQRHN